MILFVSYDSHRKVTIFTHLQHIDLVTDVDCAISEAVASVSAISEAVGSVSAIREAVASVSAISEAVASVSAISEAVASVRPCVQ